MVKKLFKDLYVFNGNEMGNNAYLLIKDKNCIVIDPSTYGNEITLFINENELYLDAIVLTHGHYDHFASSITLLSTYDDLKVYCPLEEKEVLVSHNFSKELINEVVNIPNDDVIYFPTNEKLEIGDFVLEPLLTPGHTKGSICIKYNNYVFTGDTIFSNTIGRTDLPTSNSMEMYKSIRLFLKVYKDEDIILPGHGEVYKPLSEVKKLNAFLIHFSH